MAAYHYKAFDDQGAMLLADSVQDDGLDASKAAEMVIQKWEVAM